MEALAPSRTSRTPTLDAGNEEDEPSRRAATNRRNSLQSTGPRTPTGLARASTNATTHGLTARSVVVPGESLAAWEGFRDAALGDLAPLGVMEHTLATRAAELMWRLQRAGAAEAAMATYALATAEAEVVRAAITAESPEVQARLPPARTLAHLASYDARCSAVCNAADAAMKGADTAALAGSRDAVLLLVTEVAEQARSADWKPYNDFEAKGDWSVAAVRAVAQAYAALGGAPDPERGAQRLLRKAWRSLTMARVNALEVTQSAQHRLARAKGTASVGPEVDAVRRHEAHLQRQLTSTLAMLDGLRARRAPTP